MSTPMFRPPAAQREGTVEARGFHPERGFLFLLDEKEQRAYFCHRLDNAEAIFDALRPAMRVAFATFERRDGRTAAHRVRILGSFF